jgi:hypothetical protein
MKLQVQIFTLIYSLIYGIIVSFAINLNIRYLLSNKKKHQILFTFFFILVWSFIYFLGIKNINNGIVHPVAILMIIVGFLLVNKVANRFKK